MDGGFLAPEERKEVAQFAAAAKSLTDRVTVSKEEAIRFLIKVGICTKSGRLAKRYR